MLPDLDAKAPSAAPDRSAATLAILWPSDSATNADGRATAVRPTGQRCGLSIARPLRLGERQLGRLLPGTKSELSRSLWNFGDDGPGLMPLHTEGGGELLVA